MLASFNGLYVLKAEETRKKGKMNKKKQKKQTLLVCYLDHRALDSSKRIQIFDFFLVIKSPFDNSNLLAFFHFLCIQLPDKSTSQILTLKQTARSEPKAKKAKGYHG